MSVSIISTTSAKQATSKRLKSAIARKRRQNQNVEIDKLASHIPLSTTQSPIQSDKPLSVLRLASAFLKLQDFMKETTLVNGSIDEPVSTSTSHFMEQAIDGFLIVLDKEAYILYVSETITGYVGLSQHDVLGENLVDIAHPESAVEIVGCLKPSIVPSDGRSTTGCIISQFRQFFVRFRSTIVQVNGNLKVRLPPSKSDAESGEPSVIGFVGECRLIKSDSSDIEHSTPHSTFTMTSSLDMKIISVESVAKEIVGYDPEDLLGSDVSMFDFLHPADYTRMRDISVAMSTGYTMSPHFRFLTSSGDWVWMQFEAILHYKSGTKIPLFWEVKVRVLTDAAQVPAQGAVSCNVDVQNGVQSSLPVSGSFFASTSVNSGTLLTIRKNFSSGNSTLHKSPSSVSTVSKFPSVWSPELGTSLNPSTSTNSIPSHSVSAPVAFQDSRTLTQSPSLSIINFNSQIPSDFNFSGNASPHCPQIFTSYDHNSDFLPSFDFSMLESQQYYNSSSNHQIDLGDFMLQHLLDEVIALNDDSDLSTIPGNRTANWDTTFTSAAIQDPPITSSLPKWHHLDLIEGNGKTVRVIEQAAAKWERVATRLHFESHDISRLREDYSQQSIKACRTVFLEWLQGRGRKPTTWDTVIKALKEADLSELAVDLGGLLRVS